MDLTQIRYFKVLAETQHMTKAASRLHIAQPALSRTLRNLEEELGLLLFDRTGKNLVLNDNGRLLQKHANVIIQELEDARAELTEQKIRSDAMVRVSLHAASKLLPAWIREFQSLHPDISLQITQQENELEPAAGCDIVITSAIGPARGENSVTLMEEEICLALPAGNPLARRSSVELAEVRDEPFICLYKGKGLRTVTDEYCAQAGFSPHIVLESDSPGTVRELIALGVGVSFIPRISWRGIDDGDAVKLVRISKPRCARYVNMQWAAGRHTSKATGLLRDFLIGFFARAATGDS